MSPKIKSFIKTFLLFDALSTAFLFATIGVDGMARLACHVYDDPVCADLDEDVKKDEDQSPKPRQTKKNKDRNTKHIPIKYKKECRRAGGTIKCWKTPS